MVFFYLGLAFLGAVIPYSFMGQFLLTNGLDLAEFKTQMWAAPISSFTGAAFVISSVVTFCFVWGEGRRHKMKGLWLPLMATALVGVSCGLPLFLYLRGQPWLTGGTDDEAPAAPPQIKR
jgi:ABC-type Fe3+ transport system permease subunit